MIGRARSQALRGPLRRAFEQVDPEPIIATLEPLVSCARRRRLRQVLAQRLESVTVVMDAPHDPHNGAAVLRSCDAFGVQRVHVVERGAPLSTSNAVARGAERWVDVHGHPDVRRLVATLTVTGHRLVATHPRGELLPEDLRAVDRLALVMGNEHDGICEALVQACGARVRVPMRGFVESLNVSVTAATLLAHATRGRPGDLPAEQARKLYARWLALTVPRSLEVLAARGLGLPVARGRNNLDKLLPPSQADRA